MSSVAPVHERKNKPKKRQRDLPNLRRAALELKALELHLDRVSNQQETNLPQNPGVSTLPSPDPRLIDRLRARYMPPQDTNSADLDQNEGLRSDTPAPWDGELEGSSDSDEETDSDTTGSSSDRPKSVLSLDGDSDASIWEMINCTFMTSKGPPEKGVLLPRDKPRDSSAAFTLLIHKSYLIQNSHHYKFPPKDMPRRANDFVFPPREEEGYVPPGPSPLRTSIEMSEWELMSTGDVFEDEFRWMGAERLDWSALFEQNW